MGKQTNEDDRPLHLHTHGIMHKQTYAACAHRFSNSWNLLILTGKNAKLPTHQFLTGESHGSVACASLGPQMPILLLGMDFLACILYSYLVCLPSTPIISTGISQKRILRLVLRGEQYRIAVFTSLQAPNPERPRHGVHSFGRYEAMIGSGSCPSDLIVFLVKCGRLMLLSLCLCPCLLLSPLFHF